MATQPTLIKYTTYNDIPFPDDIKSRAEILPKMGDDSAIVIVVSIALLYFNYFVIPSLLLCVIALNCYGLSGGVREIALHLANNPPGGLSQDERSELSKLREEKTTLLKKAKRYDALQLEVDSLRRQSLLNKD